MPHTSTDTPKRTHRTLCACVCYCWLYSTRILHSQTQLPISALNCIIHTHDVHTHIRLWILTTGDCQTRTRVSNDFSDSKNPYLLAQFVDPLSTYLHKQSIAHQYWSKNNSTITACVQGAVFSISLCYCSFFVDWKHKMHYNFIIWFSKFWFGMLLKWLIIKIIK